MTNGFHAPPDCPRAEANEIIIEFMQLLRDATADGNEKRIAGEKPIWKVDPSHEAAIYSHLARWKRGEKIDPDSGAHPLVHLAWRALAIAWQEVNSGGLTNGRYPSPVLGHRDFA